MTDLRAIAEAATPGPWEVFGESAVVAREDAPAVSNVGLPDAGNLFNADVYGSNWRGDARFIAAWSPDRALAALDVIEAARHYSEAEGDHAEARWQRLRDALDRWDALP